jgi:hypothetical protein
MTDEEEYENYLKIQNKIVGLLKDETISVGETFALLSDLMLTVIVASARSGEIKGKNKAEIADNARSLLTKDYNDNVKFFEELFFGEDDDK